MARFWRLTKKDDKCCYVVRMTNHQVPQHLPNTDQDQSTQPSIWNKAVAWPKNEGAKAVAAVGIAILGIRLDAWLPHDWHWVHVLLPLLPYIIIVVLLTAYWLDQNALGRRIAASSKRLDVVEQDFARGRNEQAALARRLSDLGGTIEALEQVTANILRLDDALFTLLPELVSADDPDRTMEVILESLLQDLTGAFGGVVSRAILYHPADSGDFLIPWVHYQMPITTVERARFYIGEEQHRKHGIAGQCYLERRIIVAHLAEKDGRWVSDLPEYLEFDSRRPHPPYRTFIAVPILRERTCIGVCCLDSMDATIFDAPSMQTLLGLVMPRIASLHALYQELTTLRLVMVLHTQQKPH
ncbi:MAG TPA: GAF domain-containing protein [Chloroflexota bacterium]|nr:GAF domain-containing protein [Chloroflexota bacterium]